MDGLLVDIVERGPGVVLRQRVLQVREIGQLADGAGGIAVRQRLLTRHAHPALRPADLTRSRPWRIGAQPYPVVVLEAADERVHVDAYVDALARAAGEAGIPHATVGPVADAEDAELTLLDKMCAESSWTAVRSRSGRYRFPRSDFVKSLGTAVDAAPPGDSDAAIQAWNERAALFPWSRGPFKAPVWWSTVGATLAAVFAVLFSGISQGLADKAQTPVLLTVVGVLLGVAVIVTGLMTRRIWLPLLSRFGFGTRYRWVTNSSFFAVLGADGFNGRLQRIFRPARHRPVR